MRKRLTIAEAEKRHPDLVKGQQWTNNRKKYKYVCKKHGDYTQRFDDHSKGHGCDQCGGTAFLTIKEAEIRHPDLDKGQVWQNARAIYRYVCKLHGVYLQTFDSHNSGRACAECGDEKAAKSNTITIEEAEERHPDLVKGQIWKGCDYKYLYVCINHGNYRQSFSKHGQKQGCPVCHESKGEKDIALILNEWSIPYKRQARITTNRKTSYDFQLLDRPTLIEYNGRQHYEAVNSFGGSRELDNVKRRDAFKAFWAKENGYDLIVVPYTVDIRGFLQRLNSDPSESL